MGDSQQTTTTNQNSSSVPANPQVTSTLNQLLSGVQGSLAKGSTYVPAGATTQGAWQTALNAADNPNYSGGLADAIQSYAGQAGGATGINDPTYQALRSNLANTVTTGTNASFNNSGLFGSDNNQTATAQGLGNALGALDLQQYDTGLQQQNTAAGLLPSLYAASQLPASTQAAVGASQDTNANNISNGSNTLLAQLSSILGGIGGLGGTNTTGTATQTSPTTPWWMSALGIGAQLL